MEMSMRSFPLVAFLLAGSACFAQNTAHWNYTGKTGPLVWGKLAPAYQACSKGHDQSPVNIHGAHLDAALQPIEFHYIGGALTLTNDGLGIVATVDPGSYIVAGGVRYNLIRYEFHRPSEHAVNGRLSDLEIDLVHRSDDGKQAIVATRLKENLDRPNATLATLWQHLPEKAGASEKIADMVNAGGLLPVDRGYWTYIGSELTPPCAEGVRWFVFENEISVSRSQMRAFTDLFKMNTRPLQDLHGRRIEANE
jgi:carbonic anhydrase